jgi:hypothetical protein
MSPTTRRQVVVSTAAAMIAPWRVWGAGAPSSAPAVPAGVGTAPASAAVDARWPTQPDALAREMVGASHVRIDRVRELLAKNRSLALASWDWGFGDWETALGAASHVGNREIAELLLANGAPPTIFSATMLGQLDVVKAFIAASPDAHRRPGPHGLTLLHHARAGGEGAKAVRAFLEELGGADPTPVLQPLGDADATALQGLYCFGSGETETIRILPTRTGLAFQRAGTSERNLLHLGGFEFHTPGVPEARIRFERPASGGRFAALTVHDPGLVVRAERVD